MYRRPILCTLYCAVDFLNVLKKYIMYLLVMVEKKYWYIMYYITYQYFSPTITYRYIMYFIMYQEHPPPQWSDLNCE
jgi:hypothetical protein